MQLCRSGNNILKREQSFSERILFIMYFETWTHGRKTQWILFRNLFPILKFLLLLRRAVATSDVAIYFAGPIDIFSNYYLLETCDYYFTLVQRLMFQITLNIPDGNIFNRAVDSETPMNNLKLSYFPMERLTWNKIRQNITQTLSTAAYTTVK